MSDSFLALLARSCAENRGARPPGGDVLVPTVADLCRVVESADPSERAALEESRARYMQVLPQLDRNQDWIDAEWGTTHLVESGLSGEGTDRGKVPMLLAHPVCGRALPILVGHLHGLWRQTKRRCEDEGRTPPRHPVAPLVDAWQRRPREFVAETRRDHRVLPRIQPWESRAVRRSGEVFAGLSHGRDPYANLPALPSKVLPRHRVPLLDLVDAAGVPVVAKGAAVPLESRLVFLVLMSVPPPDRREPAGLLPIRFGALRHGLFPQGWQRWRDLPRLQRALIGLREHAFHDGVGRWWPISLRYMPDDPGPDDVIVLDVAFPPGSHSGPRVRLPALERLSVKSASKWRAYIGVQSLAWKPGTTRVPAPRAGGRFTWSRDITAYPVLTRSDRRRLAFGAQDAKHRSHGSIDGAFRDLPGVVVVSEHEVDPQTGEAGWIVLPEDAAAAVRSVRSGRGRRGDSG